MLSGEICDHGPDLIARARYGKFSEGKRMRQEENGVDGSGPQTFRSSLSKIPSVLIIFLGLTAGCAFGDITIQLPQPGVTTGYSGGNERVLLVPPFIDKRPEQRVGMKKNGYGMDTANVFASQDVNSWLSMRLSNELTAAGFRVNPPGDSPSATKIQGFTHQLFIEPVVQWTTVDVESDIGVSIRVSRPDGLEAERGYYVKGMEQALFGLDDTYPASLRKSSDDLMKRIVADIINFLNRFPDSKIRP